MPFPTVGGQSVCERHVSIIVVYDSTGGLRTKSTPGFLFIFHDDLAQSRGKAMLVIIHHSLSNV